LTERGFLLYQAALGISVTGYLFLRPWLDLETFELRISQLLSLLALLVTIVYVVVERRRYPHL
ncbi:hypothetical protein HY285_03025, partial [Candidatus Peregrinibacteria bacterium]|nr:hypothetical protein [Candidatus Peregrinibacteria bacterium]